MRKSPKVGWVLMGTCACPKFSGKWKFESIGLARSLFKTFLGSPRAIIDPGRLIRSSDDCDDFKPRSLHVVTLAAFALGTIVTAWSFTCIEATSTPCVKPRDLSSTGNWPESKRSCQLWA